MKYALVAVLLLGLFGCSPGHADNNDTISIGRIETIPSAILGEQRKIWVYVPNDDYHPSKGSRRYPVVYLLDGDAHFSSVMGMIQQLSQVNGNTVCPQMILVGIPNTDRMRDLTPTHAATGYNSDSNSVKTSGGGEQFMTFIEKEVIPHIDSNYPAAPYRMLIGHSLGGLTVINTLLHHPGAFNSYLAIDPSMWWDNQRLLKEADTSLPREHYNGKTLFLAIANTMEPGMDTARVRKDTTHGTIHIRSILQLADELKKNSANGLRWSYKYYDGDNHGSVPLIAEYDALRFIFDYYRLPQADKFFDSTISVASTVAAVTDHFRKVSEQMGYNVLPPEYYINEWGYNFLQAKMMEKSHAFFQLNIDNYPSSGNVYDSMGDYYTAAGDKQKAIDMYTKALAIDNNPDTKQKLDKLKQ
jgi:predicted alpha/beta superfamily hydrolase